MNKNVATRMVQRKSLGNVINDWNFQQRMYAFPYTHVITIYFPAMVGNVRGKKSLNHAITVSFVCNAKRNCIELLPKEKCETTESEAEKLKRKHTS